MTTVRPCWASWSSTTPRWQLNWGSEATSQPSWPPSPGQTPTLWPVVSQKQSDLSNKMFQIFRERCRFTWQIMKQNLSYSDRWDIIIVQMMTLLTLLQVRSNILTTFVSLLATLRSEYSLDQQTIIGCPTQEQLAAILASVMQGQVSWK